VVAYARVERDVDHDADFTVPARLERKGDRLAPQHDLPNLVRRHLGRGHSHAAARLRDVRIERERRLLIRCGADSARQQQQEQDDDAGNDL
jgi:hypothetical protein